MATEREHLAQAIRHIARAEDMVSEQRSLIERMAEHGHDTELAEAVLQTMQITLDRMYEHRDLIEKAIAAERT
jgi:hypothetical protein